MAPYDGFTKPSSIELNTLLMWIQIHDLPDGYKGLVKTLAGKVGEYVSQEPPSTDFVGNFYRVRVRIDVRKQLQRVVSIIRAGRRELFLVKYERIPDWCSLCGMLGHLHTEHGDGVHDPSKLVFRDLKAGYAWRPSGRSPSRGGRGSGRGRMGHSKEDIDAANEELDGLREMSDDDLEGVDPNRKRGPLLAPGVNENLAQGKVGDLLNKFQPGAPNHEVPPSPPLKRDPKRSKTDLLDAAQTNGSGSQNNGSAGLRGGFRRDQ
jgi:hypothetical protein